MLNSLPLAGCDIGNNGVKYIAEALKVNTTLQHLDLGGNI